MNELLPCPFCGGEADVIDYDDECWVAHQCANGTSVETNSYETEAKAIAAWNSRAEHGTLTAEQVRKAAKSNSRKYKSPVDDGIWMKEYDWQAIADELNSRAERTCKIESSYLNDFASNHECWYEFEMQCGYMFTWDDMELPNYCPNCGAKVVGE